MFCFSFCLAKHFPWWLLLTCLFKNRQNSIDFRPPSLDLLHLRVQTCISFWLEILVTIKKQKQVPIQIRANQQYLRICKSTKTCSFFKLTIICLCKKMLTTLVWMQRPWCLHIYFKYELHNVGRKALRKIFFEYV